MDSPPSPEASHQPTELADALQLAQTRARRYETLLGETHSVLNSALLTALHSLQVAHRDYLALVDSFQQQQQHQQQLRTRVSSGSSSSANTSPSRMRTTPPQRRFSEHLSSTQQPPVVVVSIMSPMRLPASSSSTSLLTDAICSPIVSAAAAEQQQIPHARSQPHLPSLPSLDQFNSSSSGSVNSGSVTTPPGTPPMSVIHSRTASELANMRLAGGSGSPVSKGSPSLHGVIVRSIPTKSPVISPRITSGGGGSGSASPQALALSQSLHLSTTCLVCSATHCPHAAALSEARMRFDAIASTALPIIVADARSVLFQSNSPAQAAVASTDKSIEHILGSVSSLTETQQRLMLQHLTRLRQGAGLESISSSSSAATASQQVSTVTAQQALDGFVLLRIAHNDARRRISILEEQQKVAQRSAALAVDEIHAARISAKREAARYAELEAKLNSKQVDLEKAKDRISEQRKFIESHGLKFSSSRRRSGSGNGSSRRNKSFLSMIENVLHTYFTSIGQRCTELHAYVGTTGGWVILALTTVVAVKGVDVKKWFFRLT